MPSADGLTMVGQVSADGTQPEQQVLHLAAHLSPTAIRLYSYAASRHQLHPDELIGIWELTASEVSDALSELTGLKLLQPAPGRDDELICVLPELAADLLVVPLEHHVREQRRVINEIRMQMLALAPEFDAGVAHRRGQRVVEVVSDRIAARGLVEESARQCSSQTVIARPGIGLDAGTLIEMTARDEEMLARGVAMRVLYQHAARYHQPTVAYLEHLTQMGAEIRTIGDRFMDMVVFDLALGIIESVDDRKTTILIREPNILNFMLAAFERSWVMGEPFFASSPMQLSDDLCRLIVSLLIEGRSDKAIARRLGISERTCQRHVRNVMIHFGAQSRFQAGYLVGAASASEQAHRLNPAAVAVRPARPDSRQSSPLAAPPQPGPPTLAT